MSLILIAEPNPDDKDKNKVSGLSVVLIEGDHHTGHFKKFDFEELKDLFNNRTI